MGGVGGGGADEADYVWGGGMRAELVEEVGSEGAGCAGEDLVVGLGYDEERGRKGEWTTYDDFLGRWRSSNAGIGCLPVDNWFILGWVCRLRERAILLR